MEFPLIEQNYPLIVSETQALQLEQLVRKLMERIPDHLKDREARDAYRFVSESLWHPAPSDRFQEPSPPV